jgi:hypothetical protein
MSYPRLAARASMLGLAGVLSCGAAAPDPATDWYTITVADGAIVGRASHRVAHDAGGSAITDTQDISLTEAHHGALTLSDTRVERQDAAGRTVSITDRARNGDAATDTVARIDGQFVEITRRTAAGERHARVALPPGTRFDDGEPLLAGWDPVRTPQLAFDRLDIGAMVVEHVVLESVPNGPRDPAGTVAVLRRHYDGDELRAVARLSLDRDRRVVALTQPMFGTGMTLRASDRDTALREHPPYRVDLALSVASPFHISLGAARGHIRYRFAFVDGMRFTPPQTGEQRVVMTGDGATIDVCAGCGPGLPSDEAALAAARRPTAWLQSDSPEIRDIAAPVARMNASGARKMAQLALFARRRLSKIDPWGHYSALDAIKRGAGDCTEDAVVLAALGRAAGIPTRVANGLAYVRGEFHGERNAFLPHSWTLAWVDGAWRSFDMSLDGFDATHIALTVGDGDARSVLAVGELASLLEWKDMAEVRAAP